MKSELLVFFEYAHLKDDLQEVSKPFHSIANQMANALPPGAETTTCLRKLLEAKDCAVRAALPIAVAGKNDKDGGKK